MQTKPREMKSECFGLGTLPTILQYNLVWESYPLNLVILLLLSTITLHTDNTATEIVVLAKTERQTADY